VKTAVVGAGAAGLWAALHATERGPVVLVAPDPRLSSSTALAQGGIAAAVAEGDEPSAHASDTLVAGAELSDGQAVRVLTSEAPAAIRELVVAGMAFDAEGGPSLEGGHSARRVLHAGGDATGWALLDALVRAVRRSGSEWVDARAGSLILDSGRVAGVRTAEGDEVRADRVILAAGGACGIYGRRTGPDRATGEAMAMAWDAGAALADLEFVQFHPTAMDVPGHPARLLTEALRGEGAALLDADGERFMLEFHPSAELAPRDVVARAIAAVRDRTGRPVYLDATGIREVGERFPTAATSCAGAGLDLARDPIPVAPAAHYFTGGVLTDTWGRSAIPGLSAAGEVACTGVHGANRLGSNSLLEALVFGRRAAMAEDGRRPTPPPRERLEAEPPDAGPPLDELRSLADRSLGVTRTGPELEAVSEKLASGGQPATRAPALIAWLVAMAAHRREESRGGHFRADFPEPQAAWRLRQAVTRSGWSAVGTANL
jgi:L-aspartate oxidase